MLSVDVVSPVAAKQRTLRFTTPLLELAFAGALLALGLSRFYLRFGGYSSTLAVSDVSSSNDSAIQVASSRQIVADESVWLAMDSDQRWLKASTEAPLADDGLSWVEATWAPTLSTLAAVRQSLQQHGYAVIDEDCEEFRHIDITGVMDFWARGVRVPNTLRKDASKLWSVLRKVETALNDRSNIVRLDAYQQFNESNPRSLHLDGTTNMLNIWCPQHPARSLPQALLFLAGSEETRRIHSGYVRENRELLDKLSEQGNVSALLSVLGHWNTIAHKIPQIPTSILHRGRLALPGRTVLFRSAGINNNATYHAGYDLLGAPGGASIFKFLLEAEPESIEDAWKTIGNWPE